MPNSAAAAADILSANGIADMVGADQHLLHQAVSRACMLCRTQRRTGWHLVADEIELIVRAIHDAIGADQRCTSCPSRRVP